MRRRDPWWSGAVSATAPAIRRTLTIGCSLVLVHALSGAFAVARAQISPTAILDRVRIDPQRPIDFHAKAFPESVYVGQQATYQVAVLLSADARSRLRRNPEFLPPELRGLLAYELGTPTRVPPRSYDGATYEAHIFQRALFPVAAGMQMVPAPQLSYSLPQSSSYFSREERFVVKAESAAFVVKPLPADGRPDDFNGAVGVFKSVVRIDTTSARVGDPIVLTLRVQGTGNVKLLPRPSIVIDWASAVPGTERVVIDSAGPMVRGTKEFDWILTPAREGSATVPALRYAYFDPYLRKYEVAESAPITLAIRPGELAVVDEGEGGAVLPLRAAPSTETRGSRWNGRGAPPPAYLVWLLLALLAPVPAWWLSRDPQRSRRVTAPTDAGRAVDTPERSDHEDPARTAARLARREMLDTIASRFAERPQVLVSRTAVARTLRRNGVSRAVTRDAIALLDRLDTLGFSDGRDAAVAPVTTQDVRTVLQRIDAEAVPRGRIAPTRIASSRIALLAVALGGIAMGARPAHAAPQRLPADTGVATQASARDAYTRRAYADAEEQFEALVGAAPNDPTLLANWGTAAWAAGDTVHAVIGWQRAARLEPMANDLQERIALLPSGARGGVADVPAVPVELLSSGALVAWLLAWIAMALLTWRHRQRRRGTANREAPVVPRVERWARAIAVSLMCAAAGAAALGYWGMRVLDASALAVVARPETMRVAPGADADAMGGVTTGDVVQIIESSDTWQHVVHADGRLGWLPGARLVALQPASR